MEIHAHPRTNVCAPIHPATHLHMYTATQPIGHKAQKAKHHEWVRARHTHPHRLNEWLVEPEHRCSGAPPMGIRPPLTHSPNWLHVPQYDTNGRLTASVSGLRTGKEQHEGTRKGKSTGWTRNEQKLCRGGHVLYMLLFVKQADGTMITPPPCFLSECLSVCTW